MSETRAVRSRRQGQGSPFDGPRRTRRAVASVPGRGILDAVAGPAGQRSADRRVQPVPAAARRVPAARPDVRLRGGRPSRRPDQGRARVVPRRVDDRGARRDRLLDRRRHPVPARPAARPRGVEAWRCPAPRRLRRPGRQRRAVHAGRVHALRRGGRPVPPTRAAIAGRWKDGRTRHARIRPAQPLDAVALLRLYTRRRRSRCSASRRSG